MFSRRESLWQTFMTSSGKWGKNIYVFFFSMLEPLIDAKVSLDGSV